MSEPAHRKYLEKYAEPEARYAEQVEQAYGAALVVPLHGEDASFLDDLAAALNAPSERTLLIAVVNATDASPAAAHASNQRLLERLSALALQKQELESVPGSLACASLGRVGAFDLLLIDRATEGRRFPIDQGVGLARRIGMDLALALHVRSRVASPWLGCTDGDARLPANYFEANDRTEPRAPNGVRRAALTLPFLHVASGEQAVDAATDAYELSLRYYTIGLVSAGSPYGYESLGSTIVARADAYAEVRGFPRRQAGEDFYLLDKLAKLGSIHRPEREPILLRSRRSARVPFGTGARVGELIESGAGLTTYHPRVFELLRLTLAALISAVIELRESIVTDTLSRELDPGSVGAVSSALDELNGFEALRDCFGASPDPRVRQRRLHTWFDALRTLRFIHLVEARASLPRLPILQALAQAPFCAFWDPTLNENSGKLPAFSAEQALPSDVGVENAISGSVNAR